MKVADLEQALQNLVNASAQASLPKAAHHQLEKDQALMAQAIALIAENQSAQPEPQEAKTE